MVNPLSHAHACHCSSHAIQCRIHSWDTKRYSWHLCLLLAWVDWCLQDRIQQKAPLCKKYISTAAQLDRWDHLPVTAKGQGQNSLECEVPVLCPLYLLISLLLCTCWKFSPSLLVTCLSVYKHKAAITSNLPFPLSLFFVFIHALCLRHLTYCTDHHTVFFSQSSNIRL